MSVIDSIRYLFDAAQAGDNKKLMQLLGANPDLANAENSDGLTPLGFASHFGHRDVVQILLDHGANVNAVSHSKISYIPSNTALHAALAGERNIEVITLLLNHGGQTDLLDSNGHTCLHVAAYHQDNTEIIRLLLENGAPVNAKVEGGKTALTIAIEQGNDQVANLLREHGAKE
ncbi:ankyrin repeat domain-containing protein [Brevibacillus ginsengisoli]|uniref:ankyrin repeat domain-containing protein n=1 Tax=Brevibacillus ginsengisoli TaxID=363854 RepID=UPI003CE6DFE1